jgi:hypothetical protein
VKRVVFLATSLLFLVVLGAVVFAEIPAKTGMPAVAQVRLDQYIAYTYPTNDVNVETVVRAKRPGRFSREMSGGAFDDSVVYQTDMGPGENLHGGPRPLPYPPEDVWCVRLEHDGTYGPRVAPAYDVVFVALHMDIHNADWLVHKGASSVAGQGKQDILSALECDSGRIEEE